MQKVIAKYGLAAHLALLAVAPLFLFPFCGGTSWAFVLLWLAFASVLWMFFEPSVLNGETLSGARFRVRTSLFRDPLTWALLAVALVSGLRIVNSGISLSCDPETLVWRLSTAAASFLPASVKSAGLFPFLATVSVVVLVQACRHALGRAARLSFFLQASVLAGVASVALHVAVGFKEPEALRFVLQEVTNASFIGFAFGLYLLIGIVVLVAVLESEWGLAYLLAVFAVGCGMAGAFSFAPPFVSACFAVLLVVFFVYAIFYAMRVLNSVAGFKLFLALIASIVLAGLLVAATLPEGMLGERLQAYRDVAFFSDQFWEMRRVLSGMAVKSWISHLWVGTGLGSFLLYFRFHASPDDWALLPGGARMLANGWLLLLSERGVLGAMQLLVPLGFLSYSYGRRLYESLAVWETPRPVCLLAPFVVLVAVSLCFVDCSPLRPEALMIMGPILAVSAAAYPRKKEQRHV